MSWLVSCLGPLLFLLFINDIHIGITSQLRLFADDTLMYRPIYNRQDEISFQKDLDSLQQWSDAWGMKFNVAKCHILQITTLHVEGEAG